MKFLAVDKKWSRKVVVFLSLISIIFVLLFNYLYEINGFSYSKHNYIRATLIFLLVVASFFVFRGFGVWLFLRFCFVFLCIFFLLKTPVQYPDLDVRIKKQPTIYIGAIPKKGVNLSEIFGARVGVIYGMEYRSGSNSIKPNNIESEYLEFDFSSGLVRFEWFRHVELLNGNVISKVRGVERNVILPSSMVKRDTMFFDVKRSLSWGEFNSKLITHDYEYVSVSIGSLLDGKEVLVKCNISKSEYINLLDGVDNPTYVILSCN